MIKYLLFFIPVFSFAQVYQAEGYISQSGTIKYPLGTGQTVGSIETGDWMEYNVNVPVTGNYNVQLRVASPYASKLTIAGVPVSFNNTGGLSSYTTITANVPLIEGLQTIRITSHSYRWNFDWFEIGPPPFLKPIAFAGRDTTIQFPQDWFLLQGVATNGTGVWSGPNLHEAMATKLYKDTYQYIYTVTGPGGVSRDTINVTAEWNPDKIFTIIEGGAFGRYAVTNGGVVYIIMR